MYSSLTECYMLIKNLQGSLHWGMIVQLLDVFWKKKSNAVKSSVFKVRLEICILIKIIKNILCADIIKLYSMCANADQCAAMAKFISNIFPRSLHHFCRWHIMRKHRYPLSKLYKIFPDLNEQLAVVLNHPLMPTKFEAAWHMLMDRYNLHSVNVMVKIWNERTTWISAY